MKRTLFGILWVVFGAALAYAADPDFHQVAPALSRFRSGSGEVLVRFSAEKFSVLEMKDSDITAAAGKAILPKDAAPRLKMTDAGTWLTREVDKNVSVDEPVAKDGSTDASRKWKRREWQQAAAYNRADWMAFLKFTAANGLSGIEESTFKGESSYELSFDSIVSDRMEAGARELRLTPEFARQMRLSPKYPARKGGSGFVILLHDPHDNLAGRAETLGGLRALLSVNKAVPFTFLVEGAYHDPSRQVGFSGLDVAIKQTASTSPAVVHSLLNSYLVNTPMAYRLLYDRQIRVEAIDDNESLKYPAPRATRSITQEIDAMLKLNDAVNAPAFPADAKSTILGLVNTTFAYLTGDVAELSDEQYVEYFTTVSKLFRGLSQAARILWQAGVKVSAAEAAAFGNDADGYSDQASIYQKALDRNKTMIPNIIAASKRTNVLPVAFIGSFHTHGIVAQLQANDIGYVVIEPRPRRRTSEAESKRFERAIHPNTRATYLASAALNMGQVSPTTAEVNTYIVPRIAPKSAALERDRSAGMVAIKAIAGVTVDTRRLGDALDRNASLSGVRLADGGKMPPPPGNYSNAFAYFDPGDGKTPNSRPQLVFADARDKHWSEDGRYEFLAAAVFMMPPRESGDLKAGVLLALFPGDHKGRTYMTFYEPKSRRIYCFEGDRNEIVSIIPATITDMSGNKDIRVLSTEIIVVWRGRNG